MSDDPLDVGSDATAKSWTVSIDRDRCIGSGLCVVYAPASFDHDAEAKAILNDPIGDDLEAVQIAVEACPTKALAILAAADAQTEN